MAKNKQVKELADKLHCGLSLAEDLYRLGDKDINYIVDLSKKCHTLESLKMALILNRFDWVDNTLEELWERVETIASM